MRLSKQLIVKSMKLVRRLGGGMQRQVVTQRWSELGHLAPVGGHADAMPLIMAEDQSEESEPPGKLAVSC